MARPRTVSDADVLAAAARAVGRKGPARLTLAEVAAEAGLAPSTLVQRFGSKRGLLLAVAAAGRDDVAAVFAAARAGAPSPRAAIVAALTRLAGSVTTPEELANHLAFLQLDLADPEFHRLALEHRDAVDGELTALVAAAVRAGELHAPDPPRLARAVHAAYDGALIAWAIRREGAVADGVREAVETALGA